MSAKLYKLDLSPPARAAMMACEVFKVAVEMIDVDVIKRENHTSEYLKKNPLHLVPVLEDGEFIIQSRNTYVLSGCIRKERFFIPQGFKEKVTSKPDVVLRCRNSFSKTPECDILAEGVKGPTEKQLNEIEEAYGFLEEFLSRTKYIAGDEITIADISAIAVVTSLVHLLPLNVSKYPQTQAWIKNMEQQPFCQKHNAFGAAGLGKVYKAMIEA